MRTFATFLLASFIGSLILIGNPEAIPNIVSPVNRLLEKTGALYRLSTDPSAYDFYLGITLWAAPAALCLLVWLSAKVSHSYKTERNDWSAKYRALKFERDTLIDEVAAASSNANKAAAERDQLKKKVAELENTSLLNERLKQTEARLKERDDAITSLHKDAERLRSLVIEQRGEKDKFAIENAKLTQALKHIPSEDELKFRWALQTELAEARANVAALAAKLEANDKLAIDRQEYEAVLAEKAQLDGINQCLKQEAKTARNRGRRTEKLMKRLARLVTNASRQLKQVGKMRRDLDQTRKDISLLDDKIKPIAGYVEGIQGDISDALEQFSVLFPPRDAAKMEPAPRGESSINDGQPDSTGFVSAFW